MKEGGSKRGREGGGEGGREEGSEGERERGKEGGSKGGREGGRGWRLFEGGVYSRVEFNSITGILTCNLIPSTFTRQFPADTMTDREEFVFV